ncbi:hypothetical protein E0K83_02930 [Gramella sp. BOM4]|nr:hypothetical protein [Christiangramia bathymodioli]
MTFILFTIIGTVSHEFGHLSAAEFLGYPTSLHYGSLGYDNSTITNQLDSIYARNQYAMDHNLDYDEKAIFDKKYDKLVADDFKVLIGGPLQTILTGTIGFLFLIFRKKRIDKNGLKLIDWFLVFLSLFWLREVFNLVTSILDRLLFGDASFFGGDELYISQYFNLGPGTIPVIAAVIGAIISGYVIFRILPEKIRGIFILAGLTGGLTGFAFWFYLVGPVVLP